MRLRNEPTNKATKMDTTQAIRRHRWTLMGDEEYYDIELSLGGLSKDEVRALIDEVTSMPNLLRHIHVNRVKAFEEIGSTPRFGL